MPNVDIDVIGSFAPKDRALRVFREELVRQNELARALGGQDQSLLATKKRVVTDVNTVADLVQKIEDVLSQEGPSAQIRRLRLFGHGSKNLFAISPLSRTVEDLFRRAPTTRVQSDHDLSRAIQAIELETRDAETGAVVKKENYVLNAGLLAKLGGKFSDRGWSELHSCQIAGDSGKSLIRELAKLFKAPVLAGEGGQVPYGGLEGPVWMGRPDGSLSKVEASGRLKTSAPPGTGRFPGMGSTRPQTGTGLAGTFNQGSGSDLRTLGRGIGGALAGGSIGGAAMAGGGIAGVAAGGVRSTLGGARAGTLGQGSSSSLRTLGRGLGGVAAGASIGGAIAGGIAGALAGGSIGGAAVAGGGIAGVAAGGVRSALGGARAGTLGQGSGSDLRTLGRGLGDPATGGVRGALGGALAGRPGQGSGSDLKNLSRGLGGAATGARIGGAVAGGIAGAMAGGIIAGAVAGGIGAALGGALTGRPGQGGGSYLRNH